MSLREYQKDLGYGRGTGYWNLDYVPLFDSDRRVEKILILALDVSEQVRAAQESQLQAGRYQAILNSMTDVLLIARPDGTIEQSNPATSRMFELSPQLLHRTIVDFADLFDVYNRDGLPLALDQWPLARVIKGETVCNELIRIQNRRSGKQWYARTSGVPVRDVRGEPVLFVMILSDVTEQSRAEDQLLEERNFVAGVLNTGGL